MTPRAVYDTMVFFQWAVLPEGRQHATTQAVLDGKIRLCLSSELLAEVKDLLNRPAIRAKSIHLTPNRIGDFLADIAQHAKMYSAVPRRFTWPQPPDDDHIFNLTIHSHAKYLVTWEARILKLATAATPPADELRRLSPDLIIVTPKTLADWLKTTSAS